uniref:F-box domain-containing protein n=1 Tax=Panagrellus redivivus TaxID=6233 RepID=A0A7E4V928_PANRE
MESEDDDILFASLPNDFKLRVINLASRYQFDRMTEACPELETLRYRRHEDHFQNFITDHQSVYAAAAKDDNMDIFFSCCCRYLDDGPLTIDPGWTSVLLVDDIVAKNELLGISDTLILYLTSNESYDRVMPLIAGPFSRLILYGNFTWAQVQRLMHNKVKQVRITGSIDINPWEYDDVIKFLCRFARDLDYK